MALLAGTIWLNLGTTQEEVQDRFSVHFFAVAFLCFMSVSGLPAHIEGKSVFDRERRNGSYGVMPYVLSNTFTSAPFIFLITLLFTAIAYPLIGLSTGAEHVIKYIVALFLALYTMESIILIISALLPIFAGALAITAFVNGFFMVMTGYFIRFENIPKFWIWGHYWAYHTYAFAGLVFNDFSDLMFTCSTDPDTIAASPDPSADCFCAIPSDLNSNCQFSGMDVLEAYDYADVNYSLWMGILACQIVIYRILFYVILRVRKS
jgi:ABC-type multidrug transport system permease subunit